jgi:triacylglycerol lipase
MTSLRSEFQYFNPYTTKYEPENALALAKASQLAYEYNKGNRIEQTVWEWGLTDYFQLWDVDGTQSYVAANKDIILAVFAGTNEMKDWGSNLGMRPMAGPVGNVHRGFNDALERVWDDMRRAILSCKQFQVRERRRPQTLWIAGHSLGGALATLAVAKLRMEEDRAVNGLYTFGSPRVGDRTFARNFNLEFNAAYRIVNNNDVVTRVPGRLMMYSHVGQFLYIDTEKRLHEDIHWWHQFVDTFEGKIEAIMEKGLDYISDHSMSEYIEGLANNRHYNPFQLQKEYRAQYA